MFIKKYSLNDAKEYAKSKEGECLSSEEEYKTSKSYLTWKCKLGHTWRASYCALHNNQSWCKRCACIKNNLQRMISIDVVREFATKKGGKCLSSKFGGKTKNLLWQCSEGHIWKATFSNVERGTWCRKCNLISKCVSFDDLMKSIIEHGGKYISGMEEFYDSNSAVKICCSKGHIFLTNYNRVIHQKKWCSKCARENKKLNIIELQNFAIQRGGKLISEIYPSAKHSLVWQCSCGHLWEATFSSIKYENTWCPHCKISGPQMKVFLILKELFSEKFNYYECYRKFKWLKNINNLEIDIFISGPNSDFSLAIEYDGVQHFKPIQAWGGIDNFNKIKERDNIKDKLLSEHKADVKYFIRIPYWESIEKENIIRILKEKGIL